ncbi:MAG: MFS transporter [Lachnospiraceae bacterium]|nr:MFS transporter [Lachnospiraceae bacterium]
MPKGSRLLTCVIPVILIAFVFMLFFYCLQVYVSPFTEEISLGNASTAGYLFSCLSAGLAIGSFLFPGAEKKIHTMIIPVCLLMNGIPVILTIMFKSLLFTYVTYFVIGVFYSILYCYIPFLLSKIFPENLSLTQGMLQIANCLGMYLASLVPYLSGWLRNDGSYQGAFLFSAWILIILSIVALVFVIFNKTLRKEARSL